MCLFHMLTSHSPYFCVLYSMINLIILSMGFYTCFITWWKNMPLEEVGGQISALSPFSTKRDQSCSGDVSSLWAGSLIVAGWIWPVNHFLPAHGAPNDLHPLHPSHPCVQPPNIPYWTLLPPSWAEGLSPASSFWARLLLAQGSRQGVELQHMFQHMI